MPEVGIFVATLNEMLYMKLLSAITIVALFVQPAFGQTELKPEIKDTRPDSRNVLGLKSVRKLETGISVYDYKMTDGSVLTLDNRLVYPVSKSKNWEPDDLRPWRERSLKNKLMFNTWNYGIAPAAQVATSALIAILKR